MADNLPDLAAGTPPEGRDLARILNALLNIKFTVLNGAGADTDIAVTGFEYAEDTVVSLLHFDISTGTVTTVADLTSEVKAGTVPAAIQLETTATTGDKLLLIWFQTADVIA